MDRDLVRKLLSSTLNTEKGEMTIDQRRDHNKKFFVNTKSWFVKYLSNFNDCKPFAVMINLEKLFAPYQDTWYLEELYPDIDVPETGKWFDHGDFHELHAPQLSEAWFKARKNRITGSKTGYALGFSPFKTQEEIAKIILDIDQKEPSTPDEIAKAEKLQKAADHGVKTEPEARALHQILLSIILEKEVKIVERGLCVPKWWISIGSSVDGDVLDSDGVIEIKCPLRMYRPLFTHIAKINQLKKNGLDPSKLYSETDHIWKTHYCQMQQNMKVLGKKWCDYVVYCKPEKRVFVQRVVFDPNFWNKIAVPGLCSFIKTIIIPMIEKENQTSNGEHQNSS